MEHEPTPEEINVRYRFGAYLASETLPIGPLRMFEFVEVPPKEWQPGRHRSEWDQKEVGEVIDKALWVRTDAATPEQLRRALAFQLWQMGPDVERVAMLTTLLKRTEDSPPRPPPRNIPQVEPAPGPPRRQPVHLGACPYAGASPGDRPPMSWVHPPTSDILLKFVINYLTRHRPTKPKPSDGAGFDPFLALPG